jgi:phage gp36-like protein
MPLDSTYASIDDLYDRYAAADIVRYADAKAALDPTGSGPDQLKEAASGDATSGAAQQAADTVIDALADAEAEVNGYLQSSYDVPVASQPDETPRIIRRITCDIAHYRLQADPTQTASDRYDRAVSDLEKIAKGMIQLGLQADGDDAPAGGTRASAREGANHFTDGALDDWARGGNTFGTGH